MSKKKLFLILGVILLTSLIGFVGCSQYPEYHFEGKIGEEQVVAREMLGFVYNGILIEVTKPGGSKIIYSSQWWNENVKFVLEKLIIITPDGDETEYKLNSPNPAVKNLVRETQKQFEEYLEKIVEIKTAPLGE